MPSDQAEIAFTADPSGLHQRPKTFEDYFNLIVFREVVRICAEPIEPPPRPSLDTYAHGNAIFQSILSGQPLSPREFLAVQARSEG